jgi:5-hydroxyisourate hydrolase
LTVSTLSTHVLDATSGRPATGVHVRLEQNGRDGWSEVCEGLTDADGRLKLPGPAAPGPVAPGPVAPGPVAPGPVAEAGFEPGVYRITFGSGAYFAARGTASFYPEVTVTFEMTGQGGHYHVPLLLSPFAYSTYRGS